MPIPPLEFEILNVGPDSGAREKVRGHQKHQNSSCGAAKC